MTATLTYTLQELEAAVNRYKTKYGDRILWERILTNVHYFVHHRDTVLSDPRMCLEWQGFLRYLAWIESTIGLYGYTSKGTFHRVFVMFGRAYLEEKEVCETTAGTDKALEWIFESSRYFKTGDGKPGDIDLQDVNGVTYDVKNDSINFEKAHTADFLLKYVSSSGSVELHQRPKNPVGGSYVCAFTQGRPLADIAQDLGLDPLLFNKYSTEEMIEDYLGFIN
jgi:hypothetical protein